MPDYSHKLHPTNRGLRIQFEPPRAPADRAKQLDTEVGQALDRFFAGSAGEPETRSAIAEAIYASGIAESVVFGSTRGMSQMVREEIAERIRIRLVEMVTNPGFYTLHTAAQSSAAGWTRQTARKVLPSTVRDLRREQVRHGVAILGLGEPPSGVVNQHPVASIFQTVAADAFDDLLTTALMDLLDDHATAVSGLRGPDRDQVRAAALCSGTGLVPAVRPVSMEDRDLLHRAFLDDPSLAYQSLRAWYDTVFGAGSKTVPLVFTDSFLEVLDAAKALWDDQEQTTAEDLLAGPDEWAHLLATVAVAPRPRPTQQQIVAARTHLRNAYAAKRGQRSSWRALSGAVVDAWVESESEAVSSYRPAPTDPAAREVGWHIERQKLPRLLAELANLPGHPFGASPAVVLESVRAVLEPLFARPLHPRPSGLGRVAA